MQMDGRLSRMLHVLIHMERMEEPMTSEKAAGMLHTNPVVVRRTMAGLRDAGYVASVKGHGGGWTLTQPLERITMLDIYRALGEPRLFSVGPANDDPHCLVEKAVNASLATAFDDARELLMQSLAGVTLADIARDFEQRLASSGAGGETSTGCAARSAGSTDLT
jgi:DNA-binding IscR family transcriptional regulator